MKPQILVTVEGGVVDVTTPDNCPVEVILRDYDIEGYPESEITKDEDGNRCVESIF